MVNNLIAAAESWAGGSETRRGLQVRRDLHDFIFVLPGRNIGEKR
jgi:hypothetical protein